MHDETRLIDYSEARPDPAHIVKSGYIGAARYLSHTPSKNLTHDEAHRLHQAGLAIGPLFWETLALEATRGHAQGVADRVEAERQAKALGYPQACPIIYTVDADLRVSKVLPYFEGVFEHPTWSTGVYGDAMVCNGVLARHPGAILVQTAAWSQGALSRHAHIYQRVGHEAPAIPGGGYDEEVVCRPVTLWGPHGPQQFAPPGFKVPSARESGDNEGTVPFSDRHSKILDEAISLLQARSTPLPRGDSTDHQRLTELDHEVKRVSALK